MECAIIEVGPRDGLQNEKTMLSVKDKIELVQRAEQSGCKKIEVASFVHPKRVPQMADAEAVVEGLSGEAVYVGLVLNMRGAERALCTNVDELGCVAVASDTFGIRNQAQSSAESVTTAKQIMRCARDEGRASNVTIAAAWGCPFEGEVDPQRVVDMAVELAGEQPTEIALADTIGVADPWRVSNLVRLIKGAVPAIPLRAHFHNTRNTGLANAYAALMAGVTQLDASLGGIGGCPFAPNSTGNIATEDLVYMLERGGVSTGLDLAALIGSSSWLSGRMGRSLPAMVSKAGLFPPDNTGVETESLRPADA